MGDCKLHLHLKVVQAGDGVRGLREPGGGVLDAQRRGDWLDHVLAVQKDTVSWVGGA